MEKDYVLVLAGNNPHDLFGSWTPFKVRDWHTHPLLNGDSIVTLRLVAPGVRAKLVEMEAQGIIVRFPTMLSGAMVSAALCSHPDISAAGVTATDRMYDAAHKLVKFIAWPPLHPEL